jgi:hypothetical protein
MHSFLFTRRGQYMIAAYAQWNRAQDGGRRLNVMTKQVCNLVFLYKGDEPGSVLLCSRIADEIPPGYVRLWSDGRASDPGFDGEVTEELQLADVIIHCIGPKGLGFYQSLREVGKTINAMTLRPVQRLILVLLGEAKMPAELDLPQFAERTAIIHLDAEKPDPKQVLNVAVPDLGSEPSNDLEELAAIVMKATLHASVPRCLTIIVGPYAIAESTHPGATPARVIRQFLRNHELRGYAPWLDVMGSIARATAISNDDALSNFDAALKVSESQGAGQLGVYLRMLAANWARSSGSARLYIITCEPDLRVDLALRGSAMPVPHVRLVNCPRETPSMVAQRIAIVNGMADRQPIDQAKCELGARDKVVLIKPLGCMEISDTAVITAEHWRTSSNVAMDLPFGVASEIRKSCLLVLGGGVFSPSLQIVFTSLLREALTRVDGNGNRFLVHDPNSRVADPLHRIEASLTRKESRSEQRGNFDSWLIDTYGLRLKLLNPLPLLARLDKHLNNYQTVGRVPA